MPIATTPHAENSIKQLQKKYPVAWQKVLEGNNPDAIRWLIDNLPLYKSESPSYVVLEESRLQSVGVDGSHIYSQENQN